MMMMRMHRRWRGRLRCSGRRSYRYRGLALDVIVARKRELLVWHTAYNYKAGFSQRNFPDSPLAIAGIASTQLADRFYSAAAAAAVGPLSAAAKPESASAGAAPALSPGTST